MDTIYQDNSPGGVRPIGGSREAAPRPAQPGSWVLGGETHRRLIGSLIALAPSGWVVSLERAKRTKLQNSYLHALLSDIADQLHWPPPPQNDGELHDVEWWKRRCTLEWLLENKIPVEIITPLYDHRREEFGLLLPHTSDLNTAQFAELCDWIRAFGDNNRVRFSEPAPLKGDGR